jgi:predicted transcriptional regulator of viral defense system
MTKNSLELAREIFRRHLGILRTKDAMEAGIHPRTLYALRDRGVVNRISRGVYRLAELGPMQNPDLIVISARVPSGVLCLISALSFHQLTTQVPHQVWIALPRGAEPPRVDFPPIRVLWFSGEAFSKGIQTHWIDGQELKVYGPEKTLADCFKFRNKIGLDVAIEALKLYRQAGKVRVDDLVHYADVCRVRKIMVPYMEAIL